MKISHEVPICLLEESQAFNDYDYALVHLFEQNGIYRGYYEESIKDRMMILDNSLYELGSAFDSEKFKFWIDYFADINEENLYYVVPDTLNDYAKTINQYRSFNYNRANRVGVIQGSTFQELKYCFTEMVKTADVIAIPFGLKVYEEFSGNTIFEKRINGRVQLINYLIIQGLITPETKIHLLGCWLPQEFKRYKHISWSSNWTLDTSNPVVHGIKGQLYTDSGLDYKESIKLNDLINHKVTETELKNILYNVSKFRSINFE